MCSESGRCTPPEMREAYYYRIMVLNLLNLYSLIFALFGNISDMTDELNTFKNMTCTVSSLDKTIVYSISSPPDNSLYYPTNKMKTQSLISENLISDLAYNISIVSYPVMRQLLEEFSTEAITELNTPNTASSDYYYHDFIENSSIVNTTDIVFENEIFSNISILNETKGNYTELNFTDFKEIFVDYLTYILYYTFNNSMNIVENTLEKSIFNNTNNINLSKAIDNGFEMFKYTVISLLSNVSNKYDDDRVDNELSHIYNRISSTVNSLHEHMASDHSAIYETTTIPYNFVNNYNPILPTNYSMCAKLRSLCWETRFGQELIKLTVMDLVMTILSTLAIDFFRGIFVRIMNRCWCWDLERTFPKYGDFKVAENILHLVNNQGMVWMGMFFSPGLVALNVIKLYIMMYFRAWAVLTCNVPHEVIFRASRSNNFYYALLLMMLFLCVLPVGYAIVWIKPSWHCGPFSTYNRIFHILTETIKRNVPEPFKKALDYIASPGIVIPLLVLLILIIYYLMSLTGALREANDDLKIQLQRERTEERRKMFQIVDRRKGGSAESNEPNTPFTRWKKLMSSSPSGKSFNEAPKQELDDFLQPIKKKNIETNKKDYFTKIIKKALGKSIKSDDDHNADDGTDTELQDSLPDDSMLSKQHLHKFVKPSLSWGNSDFSISTNKRDLKKNLEIVNYSPSENINSSHKQDAEIQNSILSSLHCNNNFAQNNQFIKNACPSIPSTSGHIRKGSSSSVWSDIIPVITISKIESDENILQKANSKNDKNRLEKSSHEIKHLECAKFKPKIKCVLKKQSTELDKNTICHFNKNLERNIKEKKLFKTVAEKKDLEVSVLSDKVNKFPVVRYQVYQTENSENSSSSKGSDFNEISVDTILNFPYISEEHTAE